MSIYLDFNSSTPIDERVLNDMFDVYRNIIGNPDSRTHDFGNLARQKVESARRQVAEILGIDNNEVCFTSGATESNNIVLQGLKEYAKKTGKNHIITTAIEHKSILKTARSLEKDGFKVDYVYPDIDGRISSDKVISFIREETLIVSVMHVNNETGIIQPIKEIGDYLDLKDVFFHIDATQSFGKLVDELRKIKYDMLSMSAHKLGGPQGIGALILKRKKYRLPPIKGIMYGGNQEYEIRPGTIPVALVVGLGSACMYAKQEYKKNYEKYMDVKNIILSELINSGISYEINGNEKFCLPNTLNICLEGVSSEALMLSSKHCCSISNSAACNLTSYKPSYVLSAMGLSDEKIESSIRISWGANNNLNEIRNSFRELLNIAKNLRLL